MTLPTGMVQTVVNNRSSVSNLTIAGNMLAWLHASVKLISKQRHVAVAPVTNQNHRQKARMVKEFEAYITTVPDYDYNNWCKFIGGFIVPANGQGGQIHIVLLDNGLLSDCPVLKTPMPYKNKSNFILNSIFQRDNASRLQHGRMHLHLGKATNLQSDTVMGIKQLIAADHESHGLFIPRASMFSFTLRELCPRGRPIEGIDFLVRPEPQWFEIQIPLWKNADIIF